LAFSFIENQET